MIKKVAVTICALLIVLFSFGQQDSSFFYYYKDSAVYLTLDTKKAYIKFTPESTQMQRLTAVTNIFNIDSATQNNILNSPYDFTFLQFEDSLDKSSFLNDLLELKNNPCITTATPILKSGVNGEAISDKFIVKLKELTSMQKLDSLLYSNNDSIYEQLSWDNTIFIIGCTKNSNLNSLQQSNLFHQTGMFVFSEPDFLVLNPAQSLPNDTYFGDQWGLYNYGQAGSAGIDINVLNAWQITSGDPNIKIADIDEGVDLTHPDLIANLLPGFDATYEGNGGVLYKPNLQFYGRFNEPGYARN
jgi:hypothetical protein